MMAGLGRVGGEGMRGEVVGREFAGWREKEHTGIWGEKKSSNSEARWIQSRKKKRKIDQVDGPVEKSYGGGRSVCKYVTVQGTQCVRMVATARKSPTDGTEGEVQRRWDGR